MSATSEETLRISEVVTRVWSRRLLVLGCLVLGLLAGAITGTLWPASYTSTALLQISPITSTPFGSTPANQQVNIETERSVMASPEVATAVIDVLDLGLRPGQVLEDVTVSTPPDSLVLRVSFTDADPQHAADVANTFAQEYLSLRASRAEAISRTLQENLEEQITSLTNGDFGDTSSAIVQQQVLELRQEQARLAAVGVDPGNIIGEAPPPQWPSSLSGRVFLVAGGALGGLGGVVAGLLIEAFDPRVRRPQRAIASTGSPVVVARRADDEEAMLQMTSMLLGPRSEENARSTPFVVAVLCPDGPSLAITAGLGDHVRRTDHSVLTEQLNEDFYPAIDRGFPSEADRGEWDADVVLLDLGAVDSQARRAMAVTRSDALVLVSRGRSSLSSLRYWSSLARAGSVELPATWFQKRLHEGVHHSAARRSARRARAVENVESLVSIGDKAS